MLSQDAEVSLLRKKLAGPGSGNRVRERLSLIYTEASGGDKQGIVILQQWIPTVSHWELLGQTAGKG